MMTDLRDRKGGGFPKSRLPAREISAADSCFLDMLAGVKDLPDWVFWKECFNRSKRTRSFSGEKMRRLGQTASDCGEEYGEKYKDELGGAPVRTLLEAKGIIIKEFTVPLSPVMELFGLFEAPNTVSVRADLLRDSDLYLHSSGIDEIIGDVSCLDVVFAHEFFHYIENENSDRIITCTYTEPQGFFGTRRAIPALGEIAAMSFARRLLSLDYNPFMLDCVMMSMNNLPAAKAIAERLLQLENQE